MSQDCAAEEIADELLFLTGKALMTGDFDRFSTCFGLPLMMETSEGHSVIRTLEALHQRFDALRDYYHRHQVSDLVRTVVEARFIDADTIGSTHVARVIVNGGTMPRNPYPVYSVIRRHGHLDWRIMSSIYAILDCPEHNAVLSPEPLGSNLGG